MANIKCECGYEPKFPEEFDMLKTWGCARTRVVKQGFGQQVVMCNHAGEPGQDPPGTFQEDTSALKEAFTKKYEPQTPKDGTKK